MDIEKLNSIRRSFTDEQQAVYDVLTSDTDKLHQEWLLCRNMYASAYKVVNARETGPEVRIVLRAASTDYWSRRRLALERMLEMIGMNDLLVTWRRELADAGKQ